MNINAATIDRIIADVLAKLGEPADRDATVPVSQQNNSASAPKAFDLDLSHAGVLTGEMLEKLNADSVIRVATSVVLTPSAREVISKRSLTLLDTVTSGKGTVNESSALKPQLLVVTSTRETRTLADALKKDGWSIDYPGCDGDAIKVARSAICRGETNFAAILAPKPNRTAQRLNRTRNVLAAAVFPETSVGELQSEGEWNVACLAADRWASFRLKKTLETLAKGAAG